MDIELGMKAYFHEGHGIITQTLALPDKKGDCHLKVALPNGLTQDVLITAEIVKTEKVEDPQEYLSYSNWRAQAFAYEHYHFQLNIPRILDYVYGMFNNFATINGEDDGEEDWIQIEGYVTGVEARGSEVFIEFVPKKSVPPQNWTSANENQVYPEYMRLDKVLSVERREIEEAFLDSDDSIRSLASIIMNGEEPRVMMCGWDALL